ICWLWQPASGWAQKPARPDQLEQLAPDGYRGYDRNGNEILAPALPDPVRPQRPPLKPLNLSDRKACLLELAELCTSSMILDRYSGANIRSPFFTFQEFGGYFTAGVLDATVRFDRLETSPDSEVRQLASRARRILDDIWKLNRAYFNDGALWK